MIQKETSNNKDDKTQEEANIINSESRGWRCLLAEIAPFMSRFQQYKKVLGLYFEFILCLSEESCFNYSLKEMRRRKKVLFLCCFLRGLTHRKMFCFLIYLVIWKVDRMGFARTHAHVYSERGKRDQPPLTVYTAMSDSRSTSVAHIKNKVVFICWHKM